MLLNRGDGEWCGGVGVALLVFCWMGVMAGERGRGVVALSLLLVVVFVCGVMVMKEEAAGEGGEAGGGGCEG